jgi:hypothetical protein
VRTAPGEAIHLQALAPTTAAAVALISAVRTDHPGKSLIVAERDGLPLIGRLGRAVSVPGRKWLYVRVSDAVALLRKLVPVLDERLSSSALASASGARRALALPIQDRHRLPTRSDHERPASGHDRPASTGSDVALPPELLAGLLFGPGGVIDFEADPDIQLGAHRDVMAILWPRLRSDLLIW